jgi:hypothetical protein
MSEQAVPSAVGQRIIKFLTVENMNHSEILLSESEDSSEMKRSQGPRCMTVGSHLKKAEQGSKA